MNFRKRIGVLTPSSNTALEPLTAALLAALAASGARTLGLVTPYVADVQQRIVANYRDIGVDCVAERHLDLSVNFAFGDVEPETLKKLIREVAQSQPEAITTLCTNL